MKHERYRLWVSKDGCETVLLPANSPQHALLTHDTYGRRMKLRKSFLARSWEQAKRKSSNSR